MAIDTNSVGHKLYPFQSVSVKHKPSDVSFSLVSVKQSSVSFICLYKRYMPLCKLSASMYVGINLLYVSIKPVF